MGALDWIAGRLGYARPRRRGHGFAAAESSRLTSSLQTEAQFINTTLRFQGRILRARSRQAAQNNPFARRFVKMVVDNVCGPTPFLLESKVKNRKGQFDESANETIENLWKAWGRAGECEITGRFSWNTVQRLLCQIWATDGEFLVRKLKGPEHGRYGYKLQIIDVDRLYEQKNEAFSDGGAIHAGVEVDPIGRAVAYHLLKRKPSNWAHSGYTFDTERVPADQIIHVFAPEYAEQIRGVPMMYAALLNLVHLGAFEEAAVIAARIGASNMGFIESPDGGKALADMAAAGPAGDGTSSYGGNNGDPQISAEPGAFWNLPPGYKVGSGWDPKFPDAAIEPFIRACLRGVSAGLGVAYHNLANDLGEVNYSSARIGELDERDTWKGMQVFWCEHFNQPLFDDWMPQQVLVGNLSFAPDRLDKYRAVRWRGRRWAWVDPLKEVSAAVEAINARLKSRTSVAADNGDDLEEEFELMAQEAAMAKDHGIEFAVAKPAAAPAPADQGGADGDDQKPKEGKKALPRWRDERRGADPEDALEVHVHTHFDKGAIQNTNNVTVPERELNLEARIEGATVNVAPAAVEVPVTVRAYPAESVETIERGADREMSRVFRKNKD